MLRGANKDGIAVVQCMDCGCWAFDDEQDGVWHGGPNAEYDRAAGELPEAVEAVPETTTIRDLAARVRSLREGKNDG